MSSGAKETYIENFKEVYRLIFEEDKLGHLETTKSIEKFIFFLEQYMESLAVAPFQGAHTLNSVKDILKTQRDFRNLCYSKGKFLP